MVHPVPRVHSIISRCAAVLLLQTELQILRLKGRRIVLTYFRMQLLAEMKKKNLLSTKDEKLEIKQI